MGRSSKLAATTAAILVATLVSAGAAMAQSTDPSISDYQESVPGADGSVGGGSNQGSDASGPGTATEPGGDSGGSAGVIADPAETPAASEPTSGGEPTASPSSTGGSGQPAGSGSDSAAGGGSTNATADEASGDSPSGLGDLVEGMSSAFGSDSEGSGLGVAFPLLLAALIGAFAFVLIRRRREG